MLSDGGYGKSKYICDYCGMPMQSLNPQPEWTQNLHCCMECNPIPRDKSDIASNVVSHRVIYHYTLYYLRQDILAPLRLVYVNEFSDIVKQTEILQERLLFFHEEFKLAEIYMQVKEKEKDERKQKSDRADPKGI